MRRLIVSLMMLILMFAAECFGANSTMYVCTNAGGDYLADGNDSTGNGTLATPYARISKAMANHTSSSGETVTILVKGGDTLATDYLDFDNGSSKHNGINFIIESYDGTTKYTAQASNDSYLLLFRSNVTSGSVTIRDMIFSNSVAWFESFAFGANGGMNLTVEDSNITSSANVGLCFYFAPNTTADPARNLTISNSTLLAGSSGIYCEGAAGDMTISNSTLTSTNTAGKTIWFVAGRVKSLTITDSSIIADKTTGGFGIMQQDSTSACNSIRIRNTKIDGYTGVTLMNHIQLCEFDKCDIDGVGGPAFIFDFDDPDIKNVKITNNTLDSVSSTAFYSYADNVELKNNVMHGGSHTCTLSSNYCHVYDNISVGGGALYDFGNYNKVHNNTFIGSASGNSSTVITGNAVGVGPCAKGGQFYNNIVVCRNSGQAFDDYDEYCGLDSAGRNREITLTETVANTTWNATGTIMNGKGSTWATAGAKRVSVGDIVRVKAGTNVITGDYYVKSISLATRITLQYGIGASPSSVTYSIIVNDAIDCYVNYNCYYQTGSGYLARLTADATMCNTIAAMRSAWNGWNIPYGTVNDSNSISANPKFVDMDAEDFNLMADSPCINAADNGGAMGAKPGPVPPSTVSITGYIKNECNLPIEGVLVAADNGGGQDTTDMNGFYEVWVDYKWSGMVTPSREHYTFDPNWISCVDVPANEQNQNYIADNIYDLDCDEIIGLGDLAVMCENWLMTGPGIPGDLVPDETINFLDFAELANAAANDPPQPFLSQRQPTAPRLPPLRISPSMPLRLTATAL